MAYDVASPPASRLALPRWFDTRMALGILLVLASVVVGAKVFSSADSTTSVWAASRDLPAGSRIDRSDLRSVQVKLADGKQYVSAAGAVPAGYVLTRPGRGRRAVAQQGFRRSGQGCRPGACPSRGDGPCAAGPLAC